MKRIPRVCAENRLEEYVRRWMNREGKDYHDGVAGAYRDLETGGCSSGIVGELIYCQDTVRFYKRFRAEIGSMLQDLIEGTGEPICQLFKGWDMEDPLANETYNQNLLAWFGFEEAAKRVWEQYENRETEKV